MGLGVGFLVGAVLVIFITRRYIASERAKARRRRKVAKLLSACPMDLDPDLHARVMQIGLRKRRLEEELERTSGKLTEMVYHRVSLHLKQMDDAIVQLASLLQKLWNIRKEIDFKEKDVEKKIAKLAKNRESAATEEERKEIDDAIEVEKRRLDSAEKNFENIRRCDRKLTMLDSFLDNLIISTGNMRTIELQDSFERFEESVGKEVSDLEAIFERTLSELAGADFGG